VRATDCTGPKTTQDLRDCWQRSWNQKDLNALLSLYSDTASLLTGDGRFDGIDKIKAYLQPRINANTQFTFTTVGHVEPNQFGYDSGTFQQAIPQSQPQDGNYLFVAQKGEKGRLRIVQHAFVTMKPNTPPAPCPQCLAKVDSASDGEMRLPRP
jgi:ketosteroid isomerase-like protein